jgi:hypothetical protein
MRKPHVTARLLVGALVASLVACVSDGARRPGPPSGPAPALAPGLARALAPVLAPLLAGGRTSPAREQDGGGFVVEGRAVGRSGAVGAGGRAGRQVRAELGPRASDALVVATEGGRPLRIWRRGAGTRRGHAVEGVVRYEEAFPGADALVVSQGEGVEELVIARGPGAEASYEVDLPERWRLRGQPRAGLVEVLDGAGTSQLRVWARRAWDADGAEVRLALTAAGRGLRVAAPRDARWPVVIDPVFVGAGTMLAPRTDHTATPLVDGSILLVGGMAEGAIGAEIYDPLTGHFTATTGSPRRRAAHTATRLADGRVLLAGGDVESLQGTAEVYDPATGLFTPTASPLTLPRSSHTASLLTDGRVLIAGGGVPSSLTGAEVYDPATGLFTPTKSNMVAGRARHTATRLADGRVLLAGGNAFGATTEIYDPATETFAPAAPLTAKREAHTATRLADGRVLLAGGQSGLSPTSFLSSLEVYDPATGVFTALASSMATARTGHTATLLPDGRVVFAGGHGHTAGELLSLATAEWFDPGTAQCHPIRSELSASRVGHTATSLGDGRLLLTGGGADEASSAESEQLDPGDLVVTESTMSVGRNLFTASTLLDGRVLLVGGSTLALAGEVYDPATGLFSLTLGRLQTTRTGHTATTLGDGSVLFAGGQSGLVGGPFLDSGEVYDPATGVFSAASNVMTTARSFHTGTMLASGQVLIAGGYVPPGQGVNGAELYDPPTRSFVFLPVHLGLPRFNHTATRLLDGRVLLAGGESVDVAPSTAELYDPEARTFTVTAGGLATRRSSQTATRLTDGRVLLAGGDEAGSAEVYLPATGTFSPTPTLMNARRAAHTATLLVDGRVLLAGGDVIGSQGTAEVYDPATGLFTPTAGLMNEARMQHVAARLPDGRVLLVGGFVGGESLSSAEVYDPATGVFTPVGSGPATDGRTATETAQGTLLLTGGGEGEPALVMFGLSVSVSGAGGAARRHHTTTLLPDRTFLLAGGEGADGGALATLATLAEGGSPQEAGELAQARAWHTATRLPDGRVLVAGGEASGAPIDSFELVVPGTPGTTGGGKLLQPRTHHAAALLPDGRVMLVGGTNQQGLVGLAEVFDPATGLVQGIGQAPVGTDASRGFVGEGELVIAGAARALRFEPGTSAFVELSLEPSSRLTTLATGHVLGCQERCRFLGDHSPTGGNVGSLRLLASDQIKAVGTGAIGLVGTRDGASWRGWGSVIEEGAPRPDLGALARDTWLVGEQGSVGGHGWVATGKPSAPSRLSDEQVLAWRPLDGVGPVHLVTVREWGVDLVDFTLPRTVYHGPGWLYVMVHGVPGEGVGLTLQPALAGQACEQGAHCSSGFCVDKICCNQACGDSCLACSAAGKGKGEDGVCGPIEAGRRSRFGCDNPGASICGFTGTCDGAGACVLPGITTVCSDQGDRCQGGVCAPAPGSVCDEATNAVISLGGTQPCGPYLCRGGACLTRCDSHRDCAPDHRCVSEHRCEAALVLDEARDPGLLCSAHAGQRSTGGGLLVAGLVGLWLGRRRRRVALGSVLAVALVVTPGRAQPGPPPGVPAGPTPDPAREEARDLLRRGLALYQAGDAQRAAEFFLRSRRLFPAKGNTLNAANALRRLGRLDEALELYEEAVASYAPTFDEDDQITVPAAMAELRSQVGSLFVSATTTGALVVDGRERGRLPAAGSIRLLPGEHTVRVIKDGYGTFESRVTIVAGQSLRLDARLEPLAAAGGLRIEAPTLTDAEVFVDGVLVGRTPWEGTLAPGPHVVLSRQGDRGSAPTLATVLQGQTALVRLRAWRLGDTWRLVVRPATAELRLDDVPLGKGEWAGALPPGSHVITASEEGYRAVTRLLTTTEGSDPGGDVVLDLLVDEAHPRWPRKPTGKLSAELQLLYGLGYGLAGDAARGCASSACGQRGLLGGPAVSLGVSYEFPFRLSVEALGGGLTLGQHQRRTVARRTSGGLDPGGVYRIDDLLRFKGPWFGVGGGYRWPVTARWSLRARLLAGVLFARSSDTLTGTLGTATGEARMGQDRAGQQVASTPLFLLPEVAAVASIGDWRLALTVGAWVTVSSGPALPNGDLRVAPACPASSPATAPGCAGDSSQLTAETAYRPFALLLPGLGLARVF